jgi:Cu/Ag efflux protein CusF
MKRLIALTMVIVLVLGVSVTGFAAPNWKQQGGLPPGIQKKVTLSSFTNLLDLDIVPWAKNAMEKMSVKGLIKGYGDNTFKPNSSVSQLEAIIMALRIMGWEDRAVNANTLTSKYRGSKLDPWSYGYVNVAYEKGILDEVDLMYFNPNSAAKRWEVAKYFVRALGKEDEAEDHMRDKLDFKDYTAIPVGAVGYIYVMNDLGLMVGNADGTFNPNKSVSRAEMAVLLERIDGKVDRDNDGNEIYGRVVELDTRDYELKLDVDGKQKWYEGIEGVAIYHEGDYLDFDRLSRGDYVEILLNSSGKVIFIELKDEEEDKLITDYRGEVRDIDARAREITIKTGTAIFIFTVTSNADIRLNGKDAELKDIEVGDTVRLKVDDRHRVIRLDAKGDHEVDDGETEEVEGTIHAITLGRVKGITIKLDSGRLRTYNVDSDTDITLNGRTADLEDLKEDMKVEAVAKDGTAVTIDAETVDKIREVEGTIYRVDDTRIRVKSGSSYTTFEIDDDTLVYLDGKRAEADDLMVDMPVIVRYRGDTALRIQAESLEQELEGVITRINSKDGTIEVKVGSSYRTINTNRYTVIRVNGKSAAFGDLAVNMKVAVRHRAMLAIRIQASDDVTETEGIITAVSTRNNSITLEVGRRTYTYSVENADIYVEGSRAGIRDLVVGMNAELEIVNGNTVSRVDAQLEKVEGAVVSVDTGDMKITLKLYDINVTYELDGDVEVELDGEEAELEDIERRTQVELTFDDGYVVLIKG